MSEDIFDVGDKIQAYLKDGHAVRDGEVIEVVPSKKPRPNNYWSYSAEEQKDFVTFAKVKWDDGEEELIDTENLHARDSELEREFRVKAKKALDQINAKLSVARKALAEAEKISEDNGIPFTSDISPLGQSYFPSTISEKWEDIDSDFIYDVTEATSEYGIEGGGWEHSAVC